jgi:hypothetical protein
LLLGVLIDVLYGDILGQNALALVLSSAFISNIKQSFVVSKSALTNKQKTTKAKKGQCLKRFQARAMR